jgi:triose/dihydroxyacetone kinase / FAD-AMP lyase (cyclizing)
MRRAAIAAERGMGGTSGAIYAIFLNAAANSLGRHQTSTAAAGLSALLSGSLQDALDELCKYTLARQGHRTLMDALIPFVETLGKDGFAAAYEQARLGAEGTKSMKAAMGRASYVGAEVFAENGGIPDPGALGVVSILKGISLALNQS